MENRISSPREKAREINLNMPAYGSFAEIGAGQEVAAFFFKAGGASNTIAKTMSAYDMTFSDAIYGAEESGRYVCEPRLHKMIRREYELIEQRLGEKFGEERPFFSFAATVTTINYTKTRQGHGWLGIRFQINPRGKVNEAIIHVKMHDNDAISQQNALGIAGVNLIFGVYHYINDPVKFINSLMDGLSRERIEVDMLRLSGPECDHIDNRLLSLLLVNNGLTDAAMFAPDGNVLQASDFLYKKHIMALRGRFRPATFVNTDMLECGLEQFKAEEDVDESRVVPLAELTLHDIKLGKDDIDYKDFLDRVDILGSLGLNVMISNHYEYYKLVSYFSQLTKKKVGIVLGVYNLEMIFEEKYYEHLQGGILESFSTLFSRNVKLYVYPAIRRGTSDDLYTCVNFSLPDNLVDLYEYLLANKKIDDITKFKVNHLKIFSDKVLEMIKSGKGGWEGKVPEVVAEAIKEKRLFGYITPEERAILQGQKASEPVEDKA